AGNAPTGANDHLAADLLAEDAVRRADVAASFGRDRRGLQPEAVLADRRRRLVHDPVVGLAAPLEGAIEPRELEPNSDLVALEDDDRPLVAHRPIVPACHLRFENASPPTRRVTAPRSRIVCSEFL